MVVIALGAILQSHLPHTLRKPEEAAQPKKAETITFEGAIALLSNKLTIRNDLKRDLRQCRISIVSDQKTTNFEDMTVFKGINIYHLSQRYELIQQRYASGPADKAVFVYLECSDPIATNASRMW